MVQKESKTAKLEEIRETNPIEPDRAEVEKRIVSITRSNPEKLLREYRSFPDSANGRYVSADLMKEVFSDYAASREARGRYNNIVHNSAAVLASAQFRAAIQDKSDPNRTEALFITGTPGAGKTSAVLKQGVPSDARVIYEGQLIDKSGHEKVAAAISVGLNVKIVAVLPLIETALENTKKRFDNIGRGAAISTMAKIHDKTPEGLAAIHERFGKQVVISILDNRDVRKSLSHDYAEGVKLWKQEIECGPATERLNAHLDLMRREGRTSANFERQAQGQAVELERKLGAKHADTGNRPGRTGEDREEGVLKASQSQPLSPEQDLALKFRNFSQKERLADPLLKNAAKVLAIANAHIDAAYKPGSAENIKAKSMLVDVMAVNMAKGRVYEAPKVSRTIVETREQGRDRK
jgi:hypothetical protein